MFKKKETLLQNITYMAIMAAINVIFVLLTTFVPYLLFILVFLLPLTSTLVTIYCSKKYYIIYAIATLGICCICTMWNISDTLFYVLPSLITGFIFGIGIEKGFPTIYLIILTALIQVGFSYASIPLIKALLGVDIIQTFLKAFNLTEYKYVSYVVPMFILAMGIIQSTLSYGVLSTQQKKLNIEEKTSKLPRFFDSLVIFTIGICIAIFAFCVPKISYFLLELVIVLAIYKTFEIIVEKSIWKIIACVISFIIASVIVVTVYKYIPTPLQFLLIGSYGIFVGIIGLFQ